MTEEKKQPREEPPIIKEPPRVPQWDEPDGAPTRTIPMREDFPLPAVEPDSPWERR
jgi:hypothetical protein